MNDENKTLHAIAHVIKQVEDGVVDSVVGSSEVLDRSGEIISQDGWELKNYKKNPVILWGHNVREERPPIGKAVKVWKDGENKKAKLMFRVQFDLEDEFAADIYRKVKEGYINTTSVGFLPLEKDGNTYTKQELLELSFVPVPANPEAVVQLRNMGIEPIEEKSLFVESEEKKPCIKEEKKEEVKQSVPPAPPPLKEEPKEEMVSIEKKLILKILSRLGQVQKDVLEVKEKKEDQESQAYKKAVDIVQKAIDIAIEKSLMKGGEK